MEGLFIVIENGGDLRMLDKWVNHLAAKKIPAVLRITEPFLEQNCDKVRQISDMGVEVGGGGEKPFWDEPYDPQYEEVSRLKNKVESCTGKSMRFFAAKFISYNENTLRVADELGIECIEAAGTTGAKATVYKPKEYNANILSVSNVRTSTNRNGSLCDFALSSQGETPDGFRKTLFSLEVDRIVLLTWTHVSGAKTDWWEVYRDFFDEGRVEWKPLGEFLNTKLELPFSQIPINRPKV